MLDENTLIPKARFALFDYTVFKMDIPQLPYELRNFRQLQYERTPAWQMRLVYMDTHKAIALEVIEVCSFSGLHFFDTTEVYREESFDRVKELVQTSDIVYAPTVLKCFQVQPVLRSPLTARQAVDAVCYFSQAPEPFTPDNYYSFLSQAYGS